MTRKRKQPTDKKLHLGNVARRSKPWQRDPKKKGTKQKTQERKKIKDNKKREETETGT